jgi:hypothetical protein
MNLFQPNPIESFFLSWRDCSSLIEEFKEMTTFKIGTGNTVKVWRDSWNEEDDSLQMTFPDLFSFIKRKDISVKQDVDINRKTFMIYFIILSPLLLPTSVMTEIPKM